MSEHYPFKNLPLPYGYNALEPYIDTQTMHLHHDKHLQTYIENLNAALKNLPKLHSLTIPQLIEVSGRIQDPAGTQVSRNAGGVYNHRFYFNGLGGEVGVRPTSALMKAIGRRFESFEGFKKAFTTAALSVFGSGYAWLCSDGRGRLRVISSANQDCPLARGLHPILAIDVWEHAYYLKHYYKRADYIADWFRVINWDVAEMRYAQSGKNMIRL